MRAEDRDSIIAMIDRLKGIAASDMERATADLKTVVMMAADPELEWAEHPPVILTQGARTYRAFPITSSAASR